MQYTSLISLYDYTRISHCKQKKGGTAIDTSEFVSVSAAPASGEQTKPVSHPVSFEDGSSNLFSPI